MANGRPKPIERRKHRRINYAGRHRARSRDQAGFTVGGRFTAFRQHLRDIRLASLTLKGYP